MTSIRRIIIAAVVALASATASFSQSPFLFKGNEHQLDSARNQQVLLHIVNQDFFKNDEYFGDFIEGYTLPGYTLRPTVIYYPAPNVMLEAGLHTVQYSGRDKYQKTVPYLAATWQINRVVSLRMGSLDGAMSHDLHDAILDDERQLTEKPEMGAQVRYSFPKVQGEVWIDWQHYIERGDTVPERLMAGISATFTPSRPDAEWNIRIPLRITFNHIGGQISDYPDTMQTLGNASAAFEIAKRPRATFLRSYGFAFTALMFHTFTGEGVRPISNGWAVEPKAFLDTKLFDFSVAYWHGGDFYALHGNPLYSSIADREPAYFQHDRNLITAEANINYQVARDVRFSLGGKLFYDTDAQQTDYFYGFYLTIAPTIRLAKVNLN